MHHLILRALSLAIAVGWMLPAFSQNFAQGLLSNRDTEDIELGGKLSVDTMPGKRSGLGYPLRYANVMRGSVQVELNGRILKEGTDYTLGYSEGMLYMMTSVRDTDTIRVTYRHDPTRKSNATGSAMPLMKLDFGRGGSMTMLVGTGGAQRFADGTLMNSTIGGLNNDLQFGMTKLKGVYLVSSIEQAYTRADSTSPDRSPTKEGQKGTDKAIIQNLNADLGDGINLTADYQDIGTKFQGFGALQSAGYDANQVGQLEKEKGLKRIGLGLNSNNTAGFSLINNYKSIDDGEGKLQWLNYGIKSNVIDFYYTRRWLDAKFKRWNDIAEQNRQQLQKEKGITRGGMGGAIKLAGDSFLKYDSNRISYEKEAIMREEYGIQIPWFKATIARQTISENFSRMGDLEEQERGQWNKERGLERNELALKIGGENNGPSLNFSRNYVKEKKAGFNASALSVQSSWGSLNYWKRSTDKDFNRLGDLKPQERDHYIQQTLQSYALPANVTDNDRAVFQRETGIERDHFATNFKFSQGLFLSYDKNKISHEDASILNLGGGIRIGNLTFNHRQLNISPKFQRIGDLLEAERRMYGGMIGFNRTDSILHWKISKDTELQFNAMNVNRSDVEQDDLKEENASRVTAHLKGRGFELYGARRNVSADFNRINELVDPERELLVSLLGYKEEDYRLNLTAIKGLNIDASYYDANNGDEELRRYKKHANVIWQPDNKTTLQYRLNREKFSDFGLLDKSLLFAHDIRFWMISRDFGNIGKLTVAQETEQFAGEEGSQPDRRTNIIRYEHTVSKNTKLTVDNVRTNFDDGKWERVEAYKLDWQIFQKLGISWTELFIWRDQKLGYDDRTRTFGFSYDFGNNLKLTYNWHREMSSSGHGKRDSLWNMSKGSMLGFEMVGNYHEKQIQGQDATSVGTFNITNQKPLSFGSLKDIKMGFAYGTNVQVGVWKGEGKSAFWNGKILGYELGAAYNQVMIADKVRVSDRTFLIKTTADNKSPLQASLIYKIRKLANNESYIMRDYDVSYKISDSFKLSMSTDTYPEEQRNNSPLGTINLPFMKRTWNIDWTTTPSVKMGFAFQDAMDLKNKTLARRTLASLTLFEDKGSPLKISYGVEQADPAGKKRQTKHIWELSYDQRPGPNQVFSLAVSNYKWQHSIGEGKFWSGLSFRLDYQLRF